MTTLRRITLTALAALGSLTLAQAAGAESLRPGLWEMTSKVAAANPETMQALSMAQQHMANMSPEQRKSIDQLLAQSGVKMNLAEGGGVKLDFCLTKEQAANPQLPAGQPGQCTTTQTPVPGGLNVSFKCSRPQSSGNGQVIYDGDKGYSMRMNVDSTVQGQAQHMTVESTGRWVAADCGSVQSTSPPVR